MVNGEAGKGCKPRPVDRKSWERNHVLAFGIPCKVCEATGKVKKRNCSFCGGLGKVDRYARMD